MTHEDSSLLLGNTSVLTIKHCEDVLNALDHGMIEFKEKVAWKSAARLFEECKEQDSVLPVILADSSEAQLGVLAWGIAEEIVVKGSRTRVVLRDLVFVHSQPVVSSLLCLSTGMYLSDSDQRNELVPKVRPLIG